jgi:uncharacterized protein (DUF58 family)
MTLTGRFVALVALGVVPIVLFGGSMGQAGLVLAGWLVFVLALGSLDLAVAASPRAISLGRVLPSRVRLGEPVTSELFLTNTGTRTLRGVVRDGWQPSAGAGNNRAAISIPAGERRRLALQLTPYRRGERTTAHVTVRSTGPLGLWARQTTLNAPGRIRVLPPFHSRKHLPSRISRLKELDGRTSVLVRGQGTEFDSLREYVRGDDVRSIDWRATARRNDVVVRTWRPERDRRIVIVIDTGRTSAARVEDEPRLDTAFEAALLLAALASRAGDRVDFLAWDRRVRARVQGASGADLMSRMVDGMALIEPELIEMDWTALPDQLRSVTSQHALVVLITSMEAPGASTGLLSVLGQLTRRHTVVVASVSDPTVAMAARSRSSREDVYRAAAAERAMLDATRVETAARQLGAEVVSAPPAALPPALADRYIALKAAGRL